MLTETAMRALKEAQDAILERMKGASPDLEHALGHLSNVVLGVSSFLEETADSDDPPGDLSSDVLEMDFEVQHALRAIGYFGAGVGGDAPLLNRQEKRLRRTMTRRANKIVQ